MYSESNREYIQLVSYITAYFELGRIVFGSSGKWETFDILALKILILEPENRAIFYLGSKEISEIVRF